MEDENKIDRLFGERLGEGNSIPSDAAWNAIQNKMAMAQPKSKRLVPIPFLWFSAALVSGILLGTAGFYMFQLKQENAELKRSIAAQQLHFDNQLKEMEQTHFRSMERLEKQRNSDNQLLASANEKANYNSVNLIPRSVSHRTQRTDVLWDTEHGTANSNTKSRNVARLPHLALSPRSVAHRPKSIDRTDALWDTEHGRRKGSNQGNEIQNLVGVVPNNGINNSESGLVSLNENQISNANVVNESKEQGNSVSQNIAVSDKPMEADSLKKELIDSGKVANKMVVAVKKKAPTLFGLPIAIGFYISPEVASRSVNFNNSSTEDVKNYKQNDKEKFGFGAGLSLELKLPHNYFIRTGISYWNVGERNTSEYSISKLDTTYRTDNSLKVIRPDGTVSWVVGDSAIGIVGPTINTSLGQRFGVSTISEIKESVSNFSSTVQNNYHYVGVPLVLGMRLGRSRLHAGLYSGVIANVLVSSNKAVYSIYYDPESPEKYKQSYRQLSRFSFVYWGGIDFEYQLAPNWSVTLSPNIKYSLTSLYKNEPEVKQLPYSVGLLVGCSYSF